MLVPEHPERSVLRTHVTLREGTALVRCDAAGTGAVMRRGVDGLVVEQRVGQLRTAREKARAVVETGIVEEEGLAGAEGPRKGGSECYVGTVINNEIGAT